MQKEKNKDLTKIVDRADFGGLISLNIKARLNDKSQYSSHTRNNDLYFDNQHNSSLLEGQNILETLVIPQNKN